MTGGGPGHATELLVTYIYKLGFVQTQFDYAAAVTVVQFLLLLLPRLARQPADGRQRRRDRDGIEPMHRYPRWPIHSRSSRSASSCCVPFYWVVKTSLTGENIFGYPPSLRAREPASLLLRRRLVLHPVRALLPEQRRSSRCSPSLANLVFNAWRAMR